MFLVTCFLIILNFWKSHSLLTNTESVTIAMRCLFERYTNLWPTVWVTGEIRNFVTESVKKNSRRERNIRTGNDMVLRPSGDYGGGGYVDCYQQNGGGNGHHFYESIKSSLESFRLRGGMDGDFSATAADLFNDDTSSIASKKRIDSMFRTTAASVAGGDAKKTSDGEGGGEVPDRRTKSLAADDDPRYRGDNDYFDYGYGAAAADASNKNTVQEKIEKMFAEISSSELDTDVSMDTPAVGSNKYHVQYIGCAGLSGKISSLEGLQQPVRDMYFEYRENQEQLFVRRESSGSDEEKRRDFSGLLEISMAGLTIRYRDEAGDTVHRTNPFPSIAVWAALKYVCRRQPAASASTQTAPGYEYAFLPLIADPDGSDKAPLFRDVDAGDRARLDAAGDHAPVFAVVTRKAGKRLECHGFACETENDALMMAANLYGALVTAMSTAPAATEDGPEDATAGGRGGVAPTGRRVIRQRNGFTSMSSTAGSSVDVGDVAPALPPPRPPRRNKKSPSSTASSSSFGGGGSIGGTSAIVVNGSDVCSDAKTFRMTVRQPPSLRRGVCNSSSVVEDIQSARRDHEPRTGNQHSSSGGGDILTKVAIPRSRSFLGLPSSKYSRRAPGCGIEAAADGRRRRSNGSGVMGFSDMFNELRMQEGLNNMDDILHAIINVEGMSFNELKPIYKEFLMKLAMTLTKDELYQRTKAIMAEQKRKRNKRRPTVASPSSAVGRGRRLNEKLKSALNLRAAKSRIGAALMPDFCKRNKRKSASRKQPRRCSCAVNGSTSSSSLTMTSVEIRRPVDRKPDRKPDRKHQRRTGAAPGKRAVVPALKVRRQAAAAGRSPVCSTSDDSEFFLAAALRQRQHALQQQQQQQLFRKAKTRGSKNETGRKTACSASEGGCLQRVSSGYFSCSECSAVDEKCYCGDGGGGEPASLVSCSCDSDSCADSDKCYCGRPRRPRNIFDELKSRGFAASESSVSRADSPGTAWKKNELLLLRPQPSDLLEPSPAPIRGGGGIEPSKSLEYLQMTRRPSAVDHYSSVTKPAPGRMRVYGASSVAGGSSSSPSSSLSAATVYSSSSAVGGAHRKQRRSGSSGSDNFRAIDYALFANGAGGKSRGGCGRQPTDHYRGAGFGSPTASVVRNRRSYSSEAVNLAGGCRMYHQQAGRVPAARRHSVHDDVLSSFFKSDIESSLGYYP